MLLNKVFTNSLFFPGHVNLNWNLKIYFTFSFRQFINSQQIEYSDNQNSNTENLSHNINYFSSHSKASLSSPGQNLQNPVELI